jgi:hypothetical protein
MLAVAVAERVAKAAIPDKATATAAHCPLDMETASCRQSAATRAWGSIGSAEIFAEGAAHTTKKWGRTALDWPDTGMAWWAAEDQRRLRARQI